MKKIKFITRHSIFQFDFTEHVIHIILIKHKGNNIKKLQEKIATLIVDYLVYFVEFLMISFNKKTCIKFQLVLN
jgi:hypothetical protein